MVIGFIVLLVSITAVELVAENCKIYDIEPPEATVGEPFTLECNLDNCYNTNHSWYLWNEDGRTFVGEIDSIRVSNNVSVDEVGGLHYECQCLSSPTNCKNYIIAVKPVVSLTLTTEVARAGSSVNVTCTSKSYPAADSVNNYQMEHPKDIDISETLHVQDNGVVHQIQSASKINDSGLYECTVINLTINGYNPIQSEKYEVRLQVYEPPAIINISGISTPILTIFTCTIETPEEDLPINVWVQWTRSEGILLPSGHTTAQIGNVYYLLLNHTPTEDYVCNVYSNYSEGIPEDSATINQSDFWQADIIMDVTNSTNGSISEELKTPEDKCYPVAMIAVIAVLAVLCICLVTVVGLIVYLVILRKKSKRVGDMSISPLLRNPTLPPNINNNTDITPVGNTPSMSLQNTSNESLGEDNTGPIVHNDINMQEYDAENSPPTDQNLPLQLLPLRGEPSLQQQTMSTTNDDTRNHCAGEDGTVRDDGTNTDNGARGDDTKKDGTNRDDGTDTIAPEDNNNITEPIQKGLRIKKRDGRGSSSSAGSRTLNRRRSKNYEPIISEDNTMEEIGAKQAESTDDTAAKQTRDHVQRRGRIASSSSIKTRTQSSSKNRLSWHTPPKHYMKTDPTEASEDSHGEDDHWEENFLILGKTSPKRGTLSPRKKQ